MKARRRFHGVLIGCLALGVTLLGAWSASRVEPVVETGAMESLLAEATDAGEVDVSSISARRPVSMAWASSTSCSAVSSG